MLEPLVESSSKACPIQQPNVHHHRAPSSSSSISFSYTADEQDKRNKLIEAATNRLSQKRLEIKFKAMVAQIVEIQSQLEIIKIDTCASLNLLPSSDMSEIQLNHFERRLADHRKELKQLFTPQESSSPSSSLSSSSSSPVQAPVSAAPPASVIATPPSVPLLAQKPSYPDTWSSLLSICSSKELVMEDESEYAVLGGQRHDQKRRKKRHSRANTVTTIENCTSTVSSYFSENKASLVQPLHQDMSGKKRKNELLVLHSINSQERNVLDEVMSFLDDLESSREDEGFRKDLCEILDLEYESKPSSNPYALTYLVNNLFRTSWRWLRFAIVMSLAILINLRKGPNLFE